MTSRTRWRSHAAVASSSRMHWISALSRQEYPMSALPTDIVHGPLPASRKIYRSGTLHPDVRVPMREITLDARADEPPLIVYDSSGPYTAPSIEICIDRGLPRLREPWILARGDVEPYAGRPVHPLDNGLPPG